MHVVNALQKAKQHLEDVGIDGRVIFKLILKK
jgi:hypothetical protein